jgi:predicted secreted Zn-dependent protease
MHPWRNIVFTGNRTAANRKASMKSDPSWPTGHFRAGALALTLALFVFGAQSQVYKCGSGKDAVYTDKPCAIAGAEMKMPSGPGGSFGFDVLTRHYVVSAPNVAAVARTIHDNRPEGHWGRARWHVEYRGERVKTPRGCSFQSVRVQVVGEIEMPQWQEEKSATVTEQELWRKMYSSLQVHEEGHIQNGREFAMLLKERLLGLGDVSCGELDMRAQKENAILYENLRRRDEEYDRRTDHGKRQNNPI